VNTIRLPRLEYFAPVTIEELFQLKKELKDTCVLMAGGTDVLPLLKRRNIYVKNIINVKRIPQLQKIDYDEEKGLKVGAAVSLRELQEHPMILGRYPLLTKAALSVASNQIRNMGTLVGNICLDSKCSFFNQSAFWWQSRADCFKRGGDRCYVVKRGKQCYAMSAGDTVSALIALDAVLEITELKKVRRIPVEEFYTGDGQRPHILGKDDIVTSVCIPPPPLGWKEGFLKKSPRGSIDFAIVTLSVRVKSNHDGLEDIRIALNGVSSKPIRARETEAYLIGKEINHKTIKESLYLLLKEITPLSLIGASALVRRNMIAAMFTDLFRMIKESNHATNDI
jgi:4-hydroxybenzoyl-CoA reductase subunit beta